MRWSDEEIMRGEIDILNDRQLKRLKNLLHKFKESGSHVFKLDSNRDDALKRLSSSEGQIPCKGDKPYVFRAPYPEGLETPFIPDSKFKKKVKGLYTVVKSVGNKDLETELREELDARGDNPVEGDWAELFQKNFNLNYVDKGNKSNLDVSLIYEILKKSNLPEKLVKYNNYFNDLYLGESLDLDENIKGFSASWHDNKGVYIFDKAFEFSKKPFRIPNVIGLAEILIHEISHSIFKSSGTDRGLSEEFVKMRGWELSGKITDNDDYIVSKTNMKWAYPKKLYFISGYASKQPSEDFAELFCNYVWRCDFVKEKMPVIYNWIKKEFYQGYDSKAEISGRLIPKEEREEL